MQIYKKIQLTNDGFIRLKQEYDNLVLQRPKAIEELKKARELGDLSENGYYKASRAKLSFIDGRIFYLKNLLHNSHVIKSDSNNTVKIGNLVTLKTKTQNKKYRVVSKYEADPASGKISNVSPLGRGLIGKSINETITVKTPSGVIEFLLVKIEA